MESTPCDMVISDFYRVVGERVSQKGDIDDDGMITRENFAAHMMKNPADFYYGVLWNKLYRRDIIMEHDIRCNEEFTWSEDMLFNLEYIRYAESFYSLRTPVYYYVRQKKGSLSAKVTPAKVLSTKASLFKYYKQLYIDLGLYDKYKLQIYAYLVAMAKDM